MKKARRNSRLFKRAVRLYTLLREKWEKRLHDYSLSLSEVEALDWDVDEIIGKLDECSAEAEASYDVDTAMLVEDAMQYLSGEYA